MSRRRVCFITGKEQGFLRPQAKRKPKPSPVATNTPKPKPTKSKTKRKAKTKRKEPVGQTRLCTKAAWAEPRPVHQVRSVDVDVRTLRAKCTCGFTATASSDAELGRAAKWHLELVKTGRT